MAWLAWSLLAFVVAVAGHALLCRLLRRGSTVVKFLAVGLPVGLALLAVLAGQDGLSPQLLAGALVYALLSELYLFLFTLAANSVSLAILRRLVDAPLAPERIAADYDSAAMVERRLDQLQAGGLLVREGSAYRVTPQGAGMARSFARLRHVFRHQAEPGEGEGPPSA